jgi:plasmid stabilization system protein ParE
MEDRTTFQVKLSLESLTDIDKIFHYGIETFGSMQGVKYKNEILELINRLSYNYLMFVECRFLKTKQKKYRWIILDSHYIIYRIMKSEIQILRIINSKASISTIKAVRQIIV